MLQPPCSLVSQQCPVEPDPHSKTGGAHPHPVATPQDSWCCTWSLSTSPKWIWNSWFWVSPF